MNEVEKVIRESIPKDTYAREYIIKFNIALNELKDEPNALVVIFDSFIPVLESLAINNSFSFDEMMDTMKQYKRMIKNKEKTR